MAAQPVPTRHKPPRRGSARQQLAEEIAGIRHMLRQVRARIGPDRDLDEALVRMDVLLSKLTEVSGGML